MDTVRAVYARSATLSGLALRTAMWSSWSHVATIVPGVVLGKSEDYVIDATFFGGGVHARPLAELIASESKHAFREWQVPDAGAGYKFLGAQVGKPYDTLGVAGIGLHRDWQQDDAWFCSELHECFLEACGLSRFIDKLHRVTVQHSWMVR